jgi:hypothetical protein
MTKEEQIKFLESEIEKVRELDSERFKNAPENMNFQEFQTYMSETSDKLSELSRELRLIIEPTYSELPNYGTVMSMQEFIECVESGGFIDYDGFGHYVKDGKESNIVIYPSDVLLKKIRTDFDTIIWYNR